MSSHRLAVTVITLSAIPAFTDNYIWMLSLGDRHWVVDPGDAAAVVRALPDAGNLEGILVTHHHPDHIGGVAELAQRFGCAVTAPKDARIPIASERVAEGSQVQVLGRPFAVTEVPGHTTSHVAYYAAPWLFCGDTLFSLGCGRLFEGTPAQMLDSLDRLAALPPDTLVCCTHEYTQNNARFALAVDRDNAALREYVATLPERLSHPPHRTLPSALRTERACNPFLRIDDAQVRASIESHAGRPLPHRDERFGALRAWKDGFRG